MVNKVLFKNCLTWEEAQGLKHIRQAKDQWTLELEVYRLWIEQTPCGNFPIVIEGAWGIYQVTIFGQESIGYFITPQTAEDIVNAYLYDKNH